MFLVNVTPIQIYIYYSETFSDSISSSGTAVPLIHILNLGINKASISVSIRIWAYYFSSDFVDFFKFSCIYPLQLLLSISHMLGR
jgi:hypothetical protein